MNATNEDMNSFYIMVIKPFFEPFIDLAVNTVPKMILASFIFIFMLINTILELIDTPIQYWIGLMGFVLIDLFAAFVRMAMDSHSFWEFLGKFDGRKFKRTVYKIIIYPTLLIITAIYTNLFKEVFWLFQYVVVAILMGSELFSIFRHFGVLPVLYKAVYFLRTKEIGFVDEEYESPGRRDPRGDSTMGFDDSSSEESTDELDRDETKSSD